MGRINVQGLGVVEIEGDAPTEKESEQIGKALKTLMNEQVGDVVADKKAVEYADGPNFGRIATEVAGSILGSIAAGGFTLPRLAANVGMRSLPFLKALAKASAGSAAGGGAGALVSETFDPSENVAKEIARAAGEGALGEAIGAPLAIKAAPIIQKILGKPRNFADELTGARLAEDQLKNKSYEILYGEKVARTLKGLSIEDQNKILKDLTPSDDKILEYMKKKGIKRDEFTTLKNSAIESQKGLTPAFKTNDQTINILETIMSKSILGGGQFATRYRGLKTIGDRVASDVVNEMTEGSLAGNKSELGSLFFRTFTDGAQLFKKASDDMFKRVDDLLGKNTRTPALSIFNKVGTSNSLSATVAEINENIARGIGGGTDNINYGIFQKLSKDLDDVGEAFAGKFSYVDLAAKRASLAAHKQLLIAKEAFNAIAPVDKTLKVMDDMLSPQALREAGLNPKAADALEEARQFYKDGKDVFERGTVTALLNKGAKETADLGSIFQNITKGNKIDLLTRVLDDIEALPRITKNNKDIYGTAVTAKQVADLKNSLRGHFLSNMLADAFEENVQFGGFYKVDKFMRALDNNAETLKKLYPDVADRIKLEELQTTLGFAQGKISDISGIPGGVLIQLKQAGAAGQLLQFGGGLFAGGLAITGNIAPALGVIIAPKYIGKAMLDPKFQNLAFKSSVQAVIEKENTPRKMQSVYNQMLGRLVTLGVIPEAEATEVRNGIQEYLNEADQQMINSRVPLPNVPQSNFPVINQGGAATPTGSNPELAQALNLFNKGGIANATKVNK